MGIFSLQSHPLPLGKHAFPGGKGSELSSFQIISDSAFGGADKTWSACRAEEWGGRGGAAIYNVIMSASNSTKEGVASGENSALQRGWSSRGLHVKRTVRESWAFGSNPQHEKA